MEFGSCVLVEIVKKLFQFRKLMHLGIVGLGNIMYCECVRGTWRVGQLGIDEVHLLYAFRYHKRDLESSERKASLT